MIIDRTDRKAQYSAYKEAYCPSDSIFVSYIDHDELNDTDHRENKSINSELFCPKILVKSDSDTQYCKSQSCNTYDISGRIIADKRKQKNNSKLDSRIQLLTTAAGKVSAKIDARKRCRKGNIYSLQNCPVYSDDIIKSYSYSHRIYNIKPRQNQLIAHAFVIPVKL